MSKSDKSSLVAKAYMLSFAQLSIFAIVFAAVGGLVVWRSMAAPHGSPSGSCYYAAVNTGGLVKASGLPNGVVINFLMRDDVTGSQTGWVLGVADNGTWSVNVPTPAHTTTYDFVSKTWGKNGSKFDIYAECSQSV